MSDYWEDQDFWDAVKLGYVGMQKTGGTEPTEAAYVNSFKQERGSCRRVGGETRKTLETDDRSKCKEACEDDDDCVAFEMSP